MKLFSKRGVSPVIATVLLIVLVVVIAGIVFVWSKNVIPKTIEKDGEPIERACDRIVLEASIFNNATGRFLDVNNKGNVEVHGFGVRVVDEGSVTVRSSIEQTVSSGDSKRIYLNSSVYPEAYGNMTLRIAPILVGLQDDRETLFECVKPTLDVN